jgi:hypothetical protein
MNRETWMTSANGDAMWEACAAVNLEPWQSEAST